MIVNNVSTHEGGGVSLNDAPDVRFYNNTIMKNITTATAMTSNGHGSGGLPPAQQRLCRRPAPAALQRSAVVQQHLLGQPGRHLDR